MIVYLDTSAIIPLLIAEPSSVACRTLWNTADDVATTRLAYVECGATLAAARRDHRITPAEHAGALTALDALWSQIVVVPIDQPLVAEATVLADSHALRGYDAVHCASAIRVSDADMVAAAGDRRLLSAWGDLSIQTVDVNGA